MCLTELKNSYTMDFRKFGMKCLVCVSLLLILVNISDGVRFTSYSTYRTYNYYYYYYTYYTYSYHSYNYGSNTLSTAQITGIAIGVIVSGIIFFAGCILCCVCCCCKSRTRSTGQILQTNTTTISTITSSQMTQIEPGSQPMVQFSSTQYSNQEQYNTQYTAPPPSYDEVTSDGHVNIGFKKEIQ